MKYLTAVEKAGEPGREKISKRNLLTRLPGQETTR